MSRSVTFSVWLTMAVIAVLGAAIFLQSGDAGTGETVRQVFEPRSSSEPIQVAAGEVFALDMPVRLGTGHKWVIDPEAAGFVELISTKFLEPGRMADADKRQRLTLRAMRAGQGTLTLVYRRPFEPEAAGAQRVQVPIVSK